MRLLSTGDIHLTDARADEYRFRVFKSLASVARARKADAIAILGDLTDRKNEHRDALVNRIVEEVIRLAEAFPIYILRGNHDYEKDHATPFFRFLDHLEGVRFVIEPEVVRIAGAHVYFLPHLRSETPFARLPKVEADLGLTHYTFKGAVVENGFEMPTGISISSLPEVPHQWISGDIHVPQKIGRVVYCGAPHPVRFGDSFKPRFILADVDGDEVRIESVPNPTILKEKVEITSVGQLKSLDLREGDQAKVILTIPRDEFGEWPEHREAIQKWADDCGVLLGGVSLKARAEVVRKRRDDPKKAAVTAASPEAVLDEFGKEKGIPETIIDQGKALLA